MAPKKKKLAALPAPSRAGHPVLIIPGFMSSGLTIQKSPHKSWEGKRVWINIASAGFNSLHVGGALRKNERRRESMRDLRAEAGDPTERTSEEMHQEYAKQMECKSKWVWHMRLRSDMVREKEGVVVRPVPGLAGVDYLAPGALTESASYVFGPVLKLLKEKGYREEVDLDAAPYDWRIPPSELESRDGYFTDTMGKVERLYKRSDNRPVVLLCHSMGCKTGHYLLNFVLRKLGKEEGKAWIDKHVHSYVPVGAPHVGAQKTVRCMIDGDKMGLEAFLEKDEGLMMGRSLGSGLWLFPVEASFGAFCPEKLGLSADDSTFPRAPAVPPVIVRNESSLRITLPAQTLPLKSFVYNRKRLPPSKLRLAISIGEHITVRTDFVEVTQGSRQRSSLQLSLKDTTWLLACPPTIEETLSTFPFIQLALEEPGTGSAPTQPKGICVLDITWPFRFVWWLVSWICCCPCSVMWKLGCCFYRGAKRGADLGAALLGEIRVIGESGRVDWKKGLMACSVKNSEDGGEAGLLYDFIARLETTERVRYGIFLSPPKPESVEFKVKWEPNKVSSDASTIVRSQRLENVKKHYRTGKKTLDISYSSSNCKQIMQMEGLTSAHTLAKETYGTDPMGPLSISGWQPPPVSKVTAIYGINLDTEVGCVYQRNPSVRISSSDANRLQQLFILDKKAKLSDEGSATHSIKDGVISETKKTPQSVIGGDVEQKSGDGTVPYWSLQHCRTWKESCDVMVHEIPNAEHRAILNDKRFHKILLDVLECS
ncbi:hypothetical protein ACHAXT_011023 [Thalassiosira profunda]